MRLCHYDFQKIHSLLTLLCIHSTIFVIFTFCYSLQGINHLQINLEYFLYKRIMEERNVKIVRDPRKSLKSIKLKNSKNLSVTWFEENVW